MIAMLAFKFKFWQLRHLYCIFNAHMNEHKNFLFEVRKMADLIILLAKDAPFS